MRIVLVHNKYAVPGRGSGEEVMVDAIQTLLEERGHRVLPYFRSSMELQEMAFGRVRAFFSGIYNPRAQRDIACFLVEARPDFILVQNVFPLLSPSILPACRKSGAPVLMRCPNYRLICPNGLFMTQGKICEKCAGGKEYWCMLRNCEQNMVKSTGYALRGFISRRLRLFQDNVDVIMVLTSFAKQKLMENGFAPERIHVLAALADPKLFSRLSVTSPGSYVGYVGRISREKGVDTLVEAARTLPHIPFKIAGHYDRQSTFVQQAPSNVEFLGQLEREALPAFYQQAGIIVVPSRCYEGLPVVLAEAMFSATPVICSRLGGFPDIVEDGVTGLLFQHDHITELSQKIDLLWQHPDCRQQLGKAGRQKAEVVYTPDAFYNRLMAAYEVSLKLRAMATV
jgi:glycosyltransferase involved in cell wall biosynthesis